MAENSVPVDLLAGKDELGLFGTDEADTAIRDFIGIALSPLSSFLGLLDDLGACNDDVRAVAITGKSLLARADSLFDQLHANLGHPELAEDMLAHMENLVARTRETPLAGQV